MITMNPLNISIVDDNIEVAETLKDCLERDTKALKDLKIQYSTHNSTTPEQVLKEKPDMLILDYKMPHSGIAIARELKDKSPNLPILLMSGVPLAKRHEAITSAQNNDLINASFSKPFNIPKVSRLIRDNIKRPLNLGIIGLGQLGMGFLEVFSANPNIGKINAYSERIQDLYEEINGLEAVQNNRNVSLKNNLEETLENSECILLCTSAQHGTSEEKIAGNSNRSDLLSLEAEKIKQYAEQIKNLGYQGLITVLTNPIGEGLQLARNAGLEPTQLTSPFNLDEQRIRNSMIRQNSEVYDKNKKKIIVVGEHGAPIVDIPNDSSEEIKEIIRIATERAQEIPNESMKAHTSLGMNYFAPQNAYSNFFNSLAHFRPKFANSAYCYVDIGGQQGFIAVPYRAGFFPHIRITPNMSRLNQISTDTKTELAQRIKAQNLNVKGCLD